MPRRTKVVATLGPACSEPATLRAMLAAGVDVLRVNFSHPTDNLSQTLTHARIIAAELNRPLALMADLQGPKLRIGHFKDQHIELLNGQPFTLDCGSKKLGDTHFASVAYTNLCHEVNVGDHLVLGDGLIELEVKSLSAPLIHCLVIEGGRLSDNQGLNRKGGGLAAKALTAKDKEDIKTAVDLGFDYLSLSFVKDENDIEEARLLVKKYGKRNISIVAKIERIEALENLIEIIKATDVVMVARGDLGVEIGPAEVPAIQKEIIKQSRQLDKIVITATQMMESMINQPQPTRAEVSDVANAILDGTDAVLLTAETATGHYPVKVIAMVDKICLSAEKHAGFFYNVDSESCHCYRPDQAIAMATMHTANHFPINAIVALTESGASALWMSRHHSKVPIYAVSSNSQTVCQLSLVSNVFPILFDYHHTKPEKVNEQILNHLLKLDLIKADSFILLTRGHLIGRPGGTSCMQIIRV
mgnify:CR=1 FL=1